MTENGPQPEPISPSWPDTDPDPAVHGVLLSNYIKKYSERYNLIEPFDENFLEAASYKLHVGEEFWLNNERIEPDNLGQVKIPENGLLYFSIKETLNLPRFLIAVHDLKVKEVYRGLLVGRSVHVDPGYSGRINYPIFNFTSQPRLLRVGEEIATIIFIKTTPFGADCIHKSPPPNRSIKEYWRGGETHMSAVLKLQRDFQTLREHDFKELRAVVQRITTWGYIAAIALAVTIMIGIFVEIRWVADRVDTMSQRIAAHVERSGLELTKVTQQIDTLAAKVTSTEARIGSQLRDLEARINAVPVKPSVPKKPKP